VERNAGLARAGSHLIADRSSRAHAASGALPRSRGGEGSRTPPAGAANETTSRIVRGPCPSNGSHLPTLGPTDAGGPSIAAECLSASRRATPFVFISRGCRPTAARFRHGRSWRWCRRQPDRPLCRLLTQADIEAARARPCGNPEMLGRRQQENPCNAQPTNCLVVSAPERVVVGKRSSGRYALIG
jgi:hypothetical protein